MKVAFLDRDGTIVKDYIDEDWRGRVVPEVLVGAVEGMVLLNQLGYEIIIVTNQYIINDGIITLEQYHQFTCHLIEILEKSGVKILDVFYCPHSTTENCDCKKPKVGMIDMALKNYPEIELESSLMIGDSKADEDLAFNMNLKFYGIDSNAIHTEGKYQSIEEVITKNFRHKSFI